jgi:long-chain acyl-CoA synthetase
MARRAATANIDNAASELTFAHWVEELAAHGNRTAIVAFHGDHAATLTHSDLAAAIRKAAHGLRCRGLTHGDRIALWAPSSAEWIEAYASILLAGATAVPIDVQATLETAIAQIAHSGPKLIVTTTARWAELERSAPATLEPLLLDGETPPRAWRELAASDAAGSELPRVEPGDLAALLYTSGTTGAPKAVPLTHAHLLANAGALRAADLIDASDRVLNPLPLHHTYPLTVGVLTVLGTGAAVILPAGLSGPELARAATEGDASVLLAVPRLCEALFASVDAGVRARGTAAARLFDLLLAVSIAVRRATGFKIGRWLFGPVRAQLGKHLELIGCGGAKLPEELAFKLEGLGWTVLTGYGLTETSPVLTFNERTHSKLGTEGRPLPGVEIRIAPSQDDRPGEILARGPSVFGGYWNDTEHNAAAFTEAGWFRTGDLGEIDADGYLRVVGRSKELIVLADGKKVFPEALEKIYGASPLVREIAILEDHGQLAALLVPDENAVRKRGALREAAMLHEEIEDVAGRLPPYQRVKGYRLTRAPLPRTQLGKLKRHQLPALYEDAARARTDRATAPLSDEDRRLLAAPRGVVAWRWLAQRYPDTKLDLDTSPQLDLHVDSLEWVTITLELEQRLHIALTGDALSRILTLRDLLREIEAASEGTAKPAAQPVETARPGVAARLLGSVLFGLARVLMRTAFKLEVSGVEHVTGNEPILFVPNHASYLDPVAIAAALPWRRLKHTHWAAWVGVLYTSALRRLASRAVQAFPVDPDRDLAGSIETARELMRRGESVVWFPEGPRTPPGEIEPFTAGIGRLLRDAPAAVPTAIHGTFEAWPKHRARPRRAKVHVAFGPPRRFTEAERGGDTDALRNELETALRALYAETATRKQR